MASFLILGVLMLAVGDVLCESTSTQTTPWWFVPTSTTPPTYRSTAYPRWRYRTTRPSISTTTPWWFVPTSTTLPLYRSSTYPRWRYNMSTTTRPSISTTTPWWFVPSSTTPPTSTSTPRWFYPSTRRPSMSNPWLKPWRSHTTTTSSYDWLRTWRRRTTPKPWRAIDSIRKVDSWSNRDNDVYTPSPKTIDNDLWDSFTDSPSSNNVDDNYTHNSQKHGGLPGGAIAGIVLVFIVVIGLVALRMFLCYRRVERLTNCSNTRRVVGPSRVLSVTSLAAVPHETVSDRARLVGVRQTRITHA